jgi:S1-C subfamily serine protease
MRKLLCATAVAGLAGSAVLTGCGATPKQPAVPPRLTDDQLIKAAEPGVVAVQARAKYFKGEGTGFMVDDDHVLTAAHVVRGAAAITIRFSNGDRVSASIQGRNDCRDQALLKLANPEPDAVTLPLSADGPPAATSHLDLFDYGSNIQRFGHESMTTTSVQVTNGNVRRPGMPLDLPAVSPLIQTGPGPRAGSSGAAMLTPDGAVAGMIILGNQTDSMGYAIPASELRRELPALMSGDQHTSLGIDVLGVPQVDFAAFYGSQRLGNAVARYLRVTHQEGLFVTDVEQPSPADDAHIAPGDVITHVDGAPVRSMRGLCSVMLSTPAGHRITVQGVSMADDHHFLDTWKRTVRTSR